MRLHGCGLGGVVGVALLHLTIAGADHGDEVGFSSAALKGKGVCYYATEV
jgi:hypothetical protein